MFTSGGWSGELLSLFDCVQEEQQQSVLEGIVLDGEFTQAVRDSAQKLRTLVENLLNILELLLSLTFISIFTQ